MINYFKKSLRLWKSSLQKGTSTEQVPLDEDSYQPKHLSTSLEKNVQELKKLLGKSTDIVFREFNIGNTVPATLVFLDGMTDKKTINDDIIKPLLYQTQSSAENYPLVIHSLESIKKNLIAVSEVKETNFFYNLVQNCLQGDTILLIEGFGEALIISTKGWESRGVEEPLSEATVRGPREGFTENIRTNTVLLRRRIKDPNFVFEKMELGKRTKTAISITYIKGLVNPLVIEEIKRRLERINTDSILESGYIQEFIEDAPFSPFQTMGYSERPDVVAARLLEGRTAILVDGTPFVLTVPMVFIESFQAADDYYFRSYYSSLIRILRFLAFIITILAPGVYVALSAYHRELLPTPLIITMAAARQGLPFPVLVEAIIMGIIFEILREAGIRLPRPIGQAVSIVGALVIGESAVSAGIIGAPMVIVVAITAISSFVVPLQNDSSTLFRFLFTMLAGLIGLYGLLMGLLFLIIHLCCLRSFGTPYLAPIAPLTPSDLKDTIVRLPFWTMLTRPRTIGWIDPKRQEFRLEPHPPKKSE